MVDHLPTRHTVSCFDRNFGYPDWSLWSVKLIPADTSA